jgi:hypothetical protein
VLERADQTATATANEGIRGSFGSSAQSLTSKHGMALRDGEPTKRDATR